MFCVFCCLCVFICAGAGAARLSRDMSAPLLMQPPQARPSLPLQPHRLLHNQHQQNIYGNFICSSQQQSKSRKRKWNLGSCNLRSDHIFSWKVVDESFWYHPRLFCDLWRWWAFCFIAGLEYQTSIISLPRVLISSYNATDTFFLIVLFELDSCDL